MSRNYPNRLESNWKKLEKQLEKQLKNARVDVEMGNQALLRELQKKKGPADYLQDMVVLLDSRLETSSEGFTILQFLQQQTQIHVRRCINNPSKDTIFFRHISFSVNGNDSKVTFNVIPQLSKCPCVLFRWSADDFFSLLKKGNTILREHFHNLQTSCLLEFDPSHFSSRSTIKWILLLEGVSMTFRRQKADQNRDFVRQVRDQSLAEEVSYEGDSLKSSQSATINHPSSSCKIISELPSRKDIEYAMLLLQSELGFHLLLSKTVAETCDLLVSITQSIAMSAERQQEKTQQKLQKSLSFCAEVHGPSASTLSAAWRQFLEQLGHLTPAIARSITQKYPTIKSLMMALENASNAQEMLASIDIGDGHRVRTLGPALAKRLYAALTGMDSTAYLY